MEILQQGGFAVLALGGIILIFIVIIGGIPIKGQKLNGCQRLLIGLFGGFLLCSALIGLELIHNPFEPKTKTTPIVVVPTETTPSDIPLISQRAVQVLDSYYQTINNAANKLDLEAPWNYLSPEFQCLSSNCDMDEYKDFWWSVTVGYELYDCSPTTADVKLTYFNRGSGTATGQEIYLRYTLEEGMKGNWSIVNGTEIEGSNCEPYSLIPQLPNKLDPLIDWMLNYAFHLVSAFGILIIVAIFILRYRGKKRTRKGRLRKIDAPISLFPITREGGKYVSLRVLNSGQDNPAWCRASIRRMDWFKQNPRDIRGGDWVTIDTSERGPLSWHHGGSDQDGFKKVHLDPEFINIAKIPDDMNPLIRGNIVFTFLVEHEYKAGLYRLWIDVVCKQDDKYITEGWLGCIDTDVSTNLIKLTIEECDDVEKWKREAEAQIRDSREWGG